MKEEMEHEKAKLQAESKKELESKLNTERVHIKKELEDKEKAEVEPKLKKADSDVQSIKNELHDKLEASQHDKATALAQSESAHKEAEK